MSRFLEPLGWDKPPAGTKGIPLVIGDVVEAMDTMGFYAQLRVMFSDRGRILGCYEGWGHTWWTWFDVNRDIIRPLSRPPEQTVEGVGRRGPLTVATFQRVWLEMAARYGWPECRQKNVDVAWRSQTGRRTQSLYRDGVFNHRVIDCPAWLRAQYEAMQVASSRFMSVGAAAAASMGHGALGRAAAAGALEDVQQLLQLGLDPNFHDASGWTAARYAELAHHTQVVHELEAWHYARHVPPLEALAAKSAASDESLCADLEELPMAMRRLVALFTPMAKRKPEHGHD